ncbi:MAG: hypothetical protein QXI33_01665 [Candidatus Pacearchaeota archaeon]
MNKIKLSKEEYQILYKIVGLGVNTHEKLAKSLGEKKTFEIIKKFEKLGLVKISYWRGELYGFTNTKEAEELINSDEYLDWYIECGD